MFKLLIFQFNEGIDMKKVIIFAMFLTLVWATSSVFAVDSNEPNEPNVIAADIQIEPGTLNLKSNGNWITCYIELPNDVNVADINSTSLLLNGSLTPSWIWFEEEGDGLEQIAMAKFSRYAVQKMVAAPSATLTLTGELIDGRPFSGSDTIKVIGTAPVFAIKKINVKYGKFAATDRISISGTIDATSADIASANDVVIKIFSASDINEPIFSETAALGQGNVKNNKAQIKKQNKKNLASGMTSFKIDTKNHKFSLEAKNIELEGLTYPVTLQIKIGNYTGTAQK